MGVKHSKVHDVSYCINNYKELYSNDIKDIKKYFLRKNLKNNKIKLYSSLLYNRLIYK